LDAYYCTGEIFIVFLFLFPVRDVSDRLLLRLSLSLLFVYFLIRRKTSVVTNFEEDSGGSKTKLQEESAERDYDSKLLQGRSLADYRSSKKNRSND
jgi:hypothetical protein